MPLFIDGKEYSSSNENTIPKLYKEYSSLEVS